VSCFGSVIGTRFGSLCASKTCTMSTSRLKRERREGSPSRLLKLRRRMKGPRPGFSSRCSRALRRQARSCYSMPRLSRLERAFARRTMLMERISPTFRNCSMQKSCTNPMCCRRYSSTFQGLQGQQHHLHAIGLHVGYRVLQGLLCCEV
jgi:hypothetical protein